MKQLKLKRSISAISLVSALFTTQLGIAAPGDIVHAFYADEHNTTSTTPTGNRILEIDLETMSLVNTLDVPGIAGHHADNGFNSKIYGVPKGSGFVNVIDLEKDQNGTTSMKLSKKIELIHKPRSADAFNKKFNVVLMVASNRPMGSFIDVETDEVVGTIGENVDCTLTDGSRLLSHSDANTVAAATKYQCANEGHGGDQISGHPYWLTPDYAAIVDRTNNQISLYYVWQEGNQLKSRLVNHLQTRSSIHQIIPRDRTNLPAIQQADFYATEEGRHADDNLQGGIAHALIHMRLTTSGLQLIRRINLQRTESLPQAKAQRILDGCVNNYRNTNNYRNGRTRIQTYIDLFRDEGIALNPDQDAEADFPVECFYPGIPGGHNADFSPNNKHIFIGMAGGAMSVVDVNRWKIVNNLDIGIRSGPGHTCFSPKHNLALTTNHGVSYTRVIRNINTERPTISQYLPLPFTREGLISTYQSHTCYIDDNEEYYYNFWVDGGVFYKMKLADIAANTTNGNPNLVFDSIKTGGIPIQGSYIYLKDIKDEVDNQVFKANNDTVTSDGSAITIDALANDSGVNLTLEYADSARHGTVEVVNGQLRYTPNYGFSGKDGIWYGVSSPGFEWEWAFVDVTINSSVTTVPLTVSTDIATTSIGESITVDVLANDTGTGLYLGWAEATNGTATLVNDKIVYVPNAGFRGRDDFWYEVLDSSGESTWGNIIINVVDSSGTITIDGDNNDWNGWAESISPWNNTSLWIEDDANYLYIMVTAQELGEHTQIFIDSDSDNSTGYHFNELLNVQRLSAELMIEDGTAHQYSGDGTSWSWDVDQQGVVSARSGNIIEIAIPKSLLKNKATGQQVYIGFASIDSDWGNRIGYQNDYITNTYNYSLKN
jgi:hypothetical protein